VRLTSVVTSPWRGLLLGWAERSQCGALINARAAAVGCSRARLERAEVETWLAERVEATAVAASGAVSGRVRTVTSAR